MFFLIILILYSNPINAYANDDKLREAAKNYDNIEICDTHIMIRGDYEIEVFRTIMQLTSDLYRGCSVNETDIRYKTTREGLVAIVPLSQYSALEVEQEYIDKWVADKMPSIVPNGYFTNDAIDTIYDYIITNYEYDFDTFKNKKYQGAKAMIDSNKGICASFSRLFRCMVEYVPFNEYGYVDYENGKNHFKVALIYSDTGTNSLPHEWCAIKSVDQYWMYDPATDALNGTHSLMKLANYRFPNSTGYIVWQY